MIVARERCPYCETAIDIHRENFPKLCNGFDNDKQIWRCNKCSEEFVLDVCTVYKTAVRRIEKWQ